MVDGQPGADISPLKTIESSLTASLFHEPATIDDLTLALANFSRVTSPEPPSAVVCCCGSEDCENTRCWLDIKSNLESRLVLSAEVGQALLQRHEAYVRRQESHHDDSLSQSVQSFRSEQCISTTQESTDSLVEELIQHKAALSKRLDQALVNNEVAEASHKTLLHELQEARATVSRLTAQNARSVGWDARLSTVMQERDDIQQERDSEAHRARQAETRVRALNARVSKLQLEVQHLRDSVEQRRLHRLESSDSILQDARARLEALQNSQIGQTAMTEESEILKVLHTLVEDNEGLKRDNADLHRLLSESREDYNILHEEFEEQRASPPSRAGAPHFKPLLLTPSAVSSPSKRNSSTERRYRRNFEPLTPETDCFPLSPSTSLTPSDTNVAPIYTQSRYHTSNLMFEIDEERRRDMGSAALFLLHRSRGVQTDPWPGAPVIRTRLTSTSSQDPRSESSSITDSQASNMTILVERVASLLTRMAQADALTLTNRLKRQNLKGADLGHLSRVTVGGIISDASNLRAQFRHLLEDDKVVTTCTRKDLRGLFKLFKDAFGEMGQIRLALNDIILDPSTAVKFRESVLNPSKAQAAASSSQPTSGGWMAPISKFFISSVGDGGGIGILRESDPLTMEDGRGKKPHPAHRVIPKLGPALSASTTTVNVEFSGSGVGRAVTSTIKVPGESTVGLPNAASSRSPNHTPTSLMGIFAGAPQNPAQDSWVVLQKPPRTVASTQTKMLATSGQDSGINKRKLNRISRNVDAVIDTTSPMEDESDSIAPLLQRTLRRRGLSDSSIRSTFINQADSSRLPSLTMTSGGPARETPSDAKSVMTTLSRTVRNFAFTTSRPQVAAARSPGVEKTQTLNSTEVGQHSKTDSPPPKSRVSSPITGIIPDISSWAGAIDVDTGSFYVGSPREESLLRQGR